jgi:exodeoxyribonuclease V beta subunit
MKSYDETAPLPTGTVVLEASAGTGKTHAIAALATRYLAEGVVPVDRLAVISFSRMASAELRARVRERLRGTLALVRGRLAGRDVDPSDGVDGLLLAGDREKLLRREARLTHAVAGLDGASIMTIHQFCQAMLDELGVLADQDPQATLVPDADLLLTEVVDDLYLARYARGPQPPPLRLDDARRLGTDVLRLPDAPLVPEHATDRAGERLAFAAAVRDEVARRKATLGLFTFDDQLSRLRDSLRDGGGVAGAAAGRLRQRCAVVLVDEFQDTDPVQWEILRDTFHGHVPLVLIGDPKQAIYAFRGADVHSYLDAVQAASDRFSLDTNRRSDAGVVAGVGALFHRVTLGDGIPVPPVSASHTTSRLLAPPGSPWRAPVRLRCVAASEPLGAGTARDRIARDLVAEVVGLLSGGVRLQTAEGVRTVQERDIAVLVSTNNRGQRLTEALAAAGVAVTNAGSESVLAAPAAQDWLALLRALEQPTQANLRRAILTDFVGADLMGLATAGEDTFTGWVGTLQQWSRVLRDSGVAALFAAVQQQSPATTAADQAAAGGGLAERLLGRSRGERDLTDHRHLAELLHAQHVGGLRGHSLVAWLEEAIERGEGGTGDRTRRLETDRLAVQVLTVHKAKGLQFPIVLVPEAADLWVNEREQNQRLEFHDGGRRVVDLGGRYAPGRRDRRARHAAEQAEDRLRALYVAATRAQSQLTLWWARTQHNTAESPLHRLLFRDRSEVGPPLAAYPVDAPPGDRHPRELDWLAGSGISVEDAEPDRQPPPLVRPEPSAALAALPWHRSIDRRWRRTSYSGLTEAVHARPPLPPGTAEPVVGDEPAEESTGTAGSAGRPSPMAGLPGGTAFGSLVHHVLERLDWYAPTPAELPELRSRLLAATTEATGRFAVDGVAPERLAEAMLPSLLTPLGGLTGGLSLAQVPVRDRLSELDFEFALGNARSTTTLAEVAALLRHRLPADDPLAGYPDELDSPAVAGQVLRGYLTGSIDSVLRLHSDAGDRFVVVDYKTNSLGPVDHLTLEHYTPEAMTAEMLRSHYPLQAILYCVALHRFLGARLPSYDPAVHLGGVGYLFVRGMGGADAGTGGVFEWHPGATLVRELSDLLADRGAR